MFNFSSLTERDKLILDAITDDLRSKKGKVSTEDVVNHPFFKNLSIANKIKEITPVGLGLKQEGDKSSFEIVVQGTGIDLGNKEHAKLVAELMAEVIKGFLMGVKILDIEDEETDPIKDLLEILKKKPNKN